MQNISADLYLLQNATFPAQPINKPSACVTIIPPERPAKLQEQLLTIGIC